MTTAVSPNQTQPAGAAAIGGNGNRPPGHASPCPPALWPQAIPLIGLSGEYQSGKTLFGLTITDPAQMLVYDFEKSSESYHSLGFTRIDVPAQMLKVHPKGYKPTDTYQWWRQHVTTIEPGKYRVIMVDPASDIESGVTEWVRANPSYFGHTPAQYIKMSGLLWGDMKELWKVILADLASRCETFVFTVHMGDAWSGDKPTGRRKPKGKSTLMELASLFLQLERRADAKGNVPVLPSAVVLKSRLVHMKIDKGQVRMVPSLPPRLPVATPEAIRAYMLSPPDYSKLAKEERVPEQSLTEDDRAAVKLATAEATAETERLRLERLDKEQQAEQRRREAAEARDRAKAAQQAATPATAPATVPAAQPAATGPFTKIHYLRPSGVSLCSGTVVADSTYDELKTTCESCLSMLQRGKASGGGSTDLQQKIMAALADGSQEIDTVRKATGMHPDFDRAVNNLKHDGLLDIHFPRFGSPTLIRKDDQPPAVSSVVSKKEIEQGISAAIARDAGTVCKATAEQIERLAVLRSQFFSRKGWIKEHHEEAMKQAWQQILARRNVASARDLSIDQANELAASLEAAIAKLATPKVKEGRNADPF